MGCTNNNLYIMSFVVGADSGLAFVAASNESQAIQVLRNAGKYNGFPTKYQILQCRNIGMTLSISTQLLMESYVNALSAYDAFVSAITPFIGPKGDKGDRGEPARIGQVYAETDSNVGIPEVEISTSGDDFAKDILFKFKNLKGETGPMGPTGPPVAIIDNLETNTSRLALSASMGVVLRQNIENVSRNLGHAIYIGDPVATVDEPIKRIKNSYGESFYPVTHESAVRDDDGVTVGVKISQTLTQLDNQGIILSNLQSSVGALSSNDTVVAWDGSSAPVVGNIPLGVVVTYDGTDYTGTLGPSSSTFQKTYMVGNEDDDTKKMYVTVKYNDTYYWVPLGDTDVDFSDYQRKDDEVWLTEDEFSALLDDHEIDPNKTYNVYEETVSL